MRTVNVIENVDGTLVVHAFSDDKQGIKAAEQVFERIIREHFAGDIGRAVDIALADGHIDDSSGAWDLYLVHSEG